MIQQTQNSFTDGMLSVLPPEGTPNTVLTDCLNGAIISYAGKEFTLQKKAGNIKIDNMNFNSYIPIAAKEKGGVIYFVLKNNDWIALGYYSELNKETNGNKFKLLQNLKKPDEHNLDFITDEISLNNNIELELQDSYDGSVNYIITDNSNPPLLINSGFTFNNGIYQDTASINNTYYYSGKVYSQATLLKTIQTLARCEFVRSDDGGNLGVGNYAFFFKYTDLDGNETDVFCETGQISLHLGSVSLGISSIVGGQYKENSNKNIQLRLYNLDETYSRIKVYYSITSSDTQETPFIEVYEITDAYDFTSNTLDVIVTGNEPVISVTEDTINISNQKIDTAKCITQCNGHLLIANQTKENFHSNELKNLANKIILTETNDRSIGWVESEDTQASGVTLIKTEADFIDILKAAELDKATGVYMLVNNISINTSMINQFVKGPVYRIFRGRLDGNGKTIEFNYNDTNKNHGIYLFNELYGCTIENLQLSITMIGQSGGKLKYREPGVLEYNKWLISDICHDSTIKNFTLRYEWSFSENLSTMQTNSIRISPIGFSSNTIFEDIQVVARGRLVIEDFANSTKKNLTTAGLLHTTGDNISIKKIALNNSWTAVKNNGSANRANFYIRFSGLIHAKYTTNPTIDSVVIHGVQYTLQNNLQPDPSIYEGYLIGDLNNTNSIVDYLACNTWVDGTALSDRFVDKNKMTSIILQGGYGVLDPKHYEHLFSKDIWHIDPKLGMWLNHFSGPEGGLEEELQKDLEYYSNNNLYKYLGYWPDEYYRFGIVFIDKFGLLSPVYNIQGNVSGGRESGVIKTTRITNLKNSNNIKSINPIGFKPFTDADTITKLKEKGVKGYFFVRQKRIPTILGQGVCIDRDRNTGLPLLYLGETEGYCTEVINSTTSGNKFNKGNTPFYIKKANKEMITFGGCLLSPDASLNSERLSSIINGASFKLQLCNFNNTTNELTKGSNQRLFSLKTLGNTEAMLDPIAQLLHIPENCIGLTIKGFPAKSSTGNPDLKSSCETPNPSNEGKYSKTEFVRGEYTNYIAVEYKNKLTTTQNKIVNIRLSSYDDITNNAVIRTNDNSPYFAISDRLDIDELRTSEPIYRGDCFIANYTVRLNKNFLGKETPFQNGIVEEDLVFDNDTIKNGVLQEKDFDKINTADMNAVKLGTWLTFKSCANVNHIYRCIDSSNVSELSLFNQKGDGTTSLSGARKFYPHIEVSVDPWNKLLDSTVINSGYSKTDSIKGYFDLNKLIFSREQFHTRISYSNKHIASSFENNYRNFHPLAFKDYSTNLGEIISLKELSGNIIVVFEHGVGVLPVQERVLSGSGVGGEVFINSGEVLPDKPVMLSDRFGSTASQSIIVTNVAVYGIDLTHKKIWRTSGKEFEVISDFKIHDMLNDIIIPIEYNDLLSHTTAPFVCSHFDKVTGDVLFTFMNPQKKYSESIVYNELSSLWVSRLSLDPYLSVNLNNHFITFKYNDPNLIVPNQVTAWDHSIQNNAASGSFFNKPYDFEFEFVVHADKPYVQKVFNNLRIVSNNVCPDEIDYTITPDSFWGSCETFKNAVMINDEISIRQVCLDMRQVGRIRGNTMFKENIWHLSIPNIIVDTISGREKGAKLRDKWIKIRVRYKSTSPCFGKLPLIKSIITNYIESQS